jgi:hypothetical protein
MAIWSEAHFFFALAGLDPAIHVFLLGISHKDVAPRVKPGEGEGVPAVVPC